MPEQTMELIVGGTLPVITSNFDTLKVAIQERLEQYKIQVTEENLAQAKKDATELGKAALQLEKLKKDKAKEFSVPVDAFKAQVMELVGLIQNGQEFIKKQVQVFEDKTRAKCRELMNGSLKGNYITVMVRPEFQTGKEKIEEMVGISKVTKTGSLTKAAEDAIFELCRADRAMQDRHDGRIAKLEAECYKAGLKTPLTASYVSGILNADDETYNAGLPLLITNEVARQEETIRQVQLNAEREARAKILKEEQEKSDIERKKFEEKTREEWRLKLIEKERIEKEEAEKERIERERIEREKLPAPRLQILNHSPKKKVIVVAKFEVETSKENRELLQYFWDRISSISGLPACKLTIE